MIAVRVRKLRRRAGLSQLELARLAGVSRGTIAAVEAQRYHSVRSETLEGIAHGLGVSVAELVREEDATRQDVRLVGWTLEPWVHAQQAMGASSGGVSSPPAGAPHEAAPHVQTFLSSDAAKAFGVSAREATWLRQLDASVWLDTRCGTQAVAALLAWRRRHARHP